MTWRRRVDDAEFEERLDRELRYHFDRLVADKVAQGLSDHDARRAARLEFGGFEQTKEICRDVRGPHPVSEWWQDTVYAIRSFAARPALACVIVATLALGIGANTAIFSVLYQALLRPLPFPDADRLVFVWNSYPKAGSPPSDVAIPDYLDRRAGAGAIADAALFTARELTLNLGEQPEQVRALAVTPSFFSTIGRGPAFGRAFTEEDATFNADRFAILTHDTWISRFGGDASWIGRSIRLDGAPYRIVGVLPADFDVPSRRVALLVPFAFSPAQRSPAERGNEFSQMIARLRPGASIDELNAQMRTLSARLIDQLPARADFMRATGFTGVAVGYRDQIVGDARLWLYLLQAAVMVVLLIACANVANLLLIRATGRHREFAIRAALGAGRWRLTRQLLAEGLILSACGAAAALLVAALGVRGLLALASEQLPESASTGLHPPVLAFTVLVGIVTATVFGLVPALSLLRRDTSAALKEDTARGSGSARLSLARASLVVAETALAVVLLIGAGLLLKSFVRLIRVDPGFSPDHVLTAKLSLPAERYRDANAQRAFWHQLLDGARQLPGVTAVGLVSTIPLSGALSSGTYHVVGHVEAPTEKPPHARQDMVDGDYFRTMGIRLVAGRWFESSDRPTGPRVAVVDEFLAARQFPRAAAIGQQLNFGGPNTYTIVGVVRTISDADLAQSAAEGRIYLDAVQVPLSSMALVARTALPPADFVGAARAVVQRLDPEQAISDVRTMDQWVAQSLNGRRAPMTVLSLFGIVALVLSAIGTYGVVAFGVEQRVREFGIRQALGADRRSILALVLTQGLRTTAAGAMLGLGAAVAGTHTLASLLYGVGTFDWTVFGGATALLVAVAALASYVPAARATRTDPIVALRDI